MANHNVESLREEKTRLLAEALCHDLLERVGRSQAHAVALLGPGSNPNVLAATDPWQQHPELFDSMGYTAMEALAAPCKMHLTISLERAVAPELDLLSCDVSWTSDGWAHKLEHFRYSRFLTYAHMPQPH